MVLWGSVTAIPIMGGVKIRFICLNLFGMLVFVYLKLYSMQILAGSGTCRKKINFIIIYSLYIYGLTREVCINFLLGKRIDLP